MCIREFAMEKLRAAIQAGPEKVHFALPFDPEHEKRSYRYICVIETGRYSPVLRNGGPPVPLEAGHWLYGMDSARSRTDRTSKREVQTIAVGFLSGGSMIRLSAYSDARLYARYISSVGLTYPLSSLLEALDYLAFQDQCHAAAGDIMRGLLGLCLQLISDEEQFSSLSKPKRLWRKISAHIASNLSGDLSNRAVAPVFAVNPSYINRLCLQHTGKTFTVFVREQRMIVAAEMLRSGFLVKQAADECGYHSVSYFSRHFKQVTGMTPAHCTEWSPGDTD